MSLPPSDVPPPFANYAGPMPKESSRRPGVLIGIGIASLLVGLLSISASGFTSSFWWNAYVRSSPPVVAPVPQLPPLPASTLLPYTGQTKRPTGLPADARAAVLSGMPSLSPQRHRLMDGLLANFGRAIFPTLTPVPLVPNPANAIDVMYQQSADGFSVPGMPQAKVFVTDQIADFIPTHTSNDQENAYIVWGRAIAQPRTTLNWAGWSVLDIDDDLAQIRRDHPTVTPAQQAFMADKMLAMGSPDFGWSPGAHSCLDQLTFHPNGMLHARMSGYSYWFLPDGRGIADGANAVSLDPATGSPIARSPFPTIMFRPLYPGSPQAMRNLAIYCFVVVCAAILLMVAGGMMLSGQLVSVRLHVVWAISKLLLIAIEVALSLRLFASMRGSAPGGSLRAFDVKVGEAGVVQTVIVQLVYPVALLLILFLSPAVRDFLYPSPTTSDGFEGGLR